MDAMKSWKHVGYGCANSSVDALSPSDSKSTLNSLAFIAILKVQEQVLKTMSKYYTAQHYTLAEVSSVIPMLLRPVCTKDVSCCILIVAALPF